MKKKIYIVVLSLLTITFCKTAMSSGDNITHFLGQKFPTDESREAHKDKKLTCSMEEEVFPICKFIDLEPYSEFFQALKGVYHDKRRPAGCPFWDKEILESYGFEIFVTGTTRTIICSHESDQGSIYKFCTGSANRGNPAAFYLRVIKGAQMQKIIEDNGFDQLQIPKESLICLSNQEKVQSLKDVNQCYEFVVRSKELNLKSREDTISFLREKSYEEQVTIATQLAGLICLSGLGDIGWHNIQINEDNGKLVIVDTEPIYCSLMLDLKKEENGYYEMPESWKSLPREEKVYSFGKQNLWLATRNLLEDISLKESIEVGLNELQKDMKAEKKPQERLPIFAGVIFSARYFFFKEKIRKRIRRRLRVRSFIFSLAEKLRKKKSMQENNFVVG